MIIVYSFIIKYLEHIKFMKIYFILFISFIISVSIDAQIDSNTKSFKIPAVESEKDSTDFNAVFPSKPIKSNNDLNIIKTPTSVTPLKFPKKELSMFSEEEFGDPGELYTNQVNKHLDKIKKELKEDIGLGTKGSKVDVYFGEYTTKSKNVRVLYRDYGLVDGDVIRVSVNDEIIEFRVALVAQFRGFKIRLKEGYNKIEFLALNEGYALPNTAHFRVIDDENNIIASSEWALSINVKGSINIVKK